LLGPKKLRTRTTGINTEQAITVIPPVVAARATTTTLVAVTGGHIYMTRLAGERYHTRRNCGHIMGREQKVIEKCLDCALGQVRLSLRVILSEGDQHT
jgi:hypothetical protein